MTDTPSAIPYGAPATAGQAVFSTGTSTANWAYSAWDATTVTAAAGPQAGSSPPVPVLGTTPVPSPIRGSLTCGTGGTAPTGTLVTVTFGATLPSTPVVALTATTAVAGTLAASVQGVSTTGFSIFVDQAPAASQANTVYGFAWVASL